MKQKDLIYDVPRPVPSSLHLCCNQSVSFQKLWISFIFIFVVIALMTCVATYWFFTNSALMEKNKVFEEQLEYSELARPEIANEVSPMIRQTLNG
jgi:flagellar basal body-associated protein FliL